MCVRTCLRYNYCTITCPVGCQATFLPLVPPVLLQLTKAPTVSAADFSSVRMVFYGAAPVAKEIEMEWDRRFPLVRRKQGRPPPTPHPQALRMVLLCRMKWQLEYFRTQNLISFSFMIYHAPRYVFRLWYDGAGFWCVDDAQRRSLPVRLGWIRSTAHAVAHRRRGHGARLRCGRGGRAVVSRRQRHERLLQAS